MCSLEPAGCNYCRNAGVYKVVVSSGVFASCSCLTQTLPRALCASTWKGHRRHYNLVFRAPSVTYPLLLFHKLSMDFQAKRYIYLGVRSTLVIMIRLKMFLPAYKTKQLEMTAPTECFLLEKSKAPLDNCKGKLPQKWKDKTTQRGLSPCGLTRVLGSTIDSDAHAVKFDHAHCNTNVHTSIVFGRMSRPRLGSL